MKNNLLSRVIYKVKYILLQSSIINITGKVGRNLTITNATIFGDVNIGCNVKIKGGVSIGGAVDIGNNTSINGPNTDIFSKINKIKIGKFCSIARNVTIQEFNHKFNRLTSYFIFQNKFDESVENDIYSNGSIEIGDDVWIGTQCVILSGAKIGNGAVVAANSVVRGEVPPYAIVGGSPAKIIKYRFSEEIIVKLEKLKWWDWSDNKLLLNKNLFNGEISINKLKSVQ